MNNEMIITQMKELCRSGGPESKKEFFKKAPKVTVGSTVGAGDSFGATFICEYFKTKNIEKSLEKAIEISAFVVSEKEAIPEY